MNERKNANITHWNEAASRHFETKSELYDVEAFKRGAQTLRTIELEKLSNVKGLSILHLQCHFGLDSMSLTRLGAQVTGVDFSDKSIALAQELAAELNLNTQFICCDIYDLPTKLSQQFDLVFTSYGVLGWLSDLAHWAEIVAKFMKKDARFVLVDGHPFIDMLGHPIDGKPENEQLEVLYPYFDTAPLPVAWASSYANSSVEDFSGSVHYEYTHTLAEIISSLTKAGLCITSLDEYPFFMYKQFERLDATSDGYWKQPIGEISVPALFSLTATKS